MPRIDYEPKLDFKDVLLRPKRSTLKSRADVSLVREYVFRNSKHTYKGIPVVASNMDTVGTFEMASALSQAQLFTCIHKHYSVDMWKQFRDTCLASEAPVLQHTAVSTGSSDADFEKMRATLAAVPEIEFICVDVANGYSEHFVNFIRRVR